MIALKLFILIVVIHLSCSVTNEYRTYENYKLFEVHGERSTLEELIDFMTEKYEIPYHQVRDQKATVLISPELTTIFQNLAEFENLSYNVVVNDYSRILDAERNSLVRSKQSFSWTAYYDIDDIYDYLHNTSDANPDWAEEIVAGKSYEGREIRGIRINTPGDVNKPVFFIESGIHAREWITPATTTYFINQLLTSSDPKITALRDQFDWRIFPTVNPDGYHHSFTVDRFWRKTRSRSPNGCYGADPNRNWDYNWLEYGASNQPCNYQTYAGARPFSEIETSSLSSYVSQIENLLAYVAFHSDAQMLLLPYSDSVEHIDNYDDLVTIGKVSLGHGKEVNGEKYEGPATAAEILYKVSGGSMDWVRNALGTPLVYTYELRGRYFHWPANRISEQGEEVTQMMVGLAAEAKNLGYY
ncbi:hypothetical protein K1T71_004130 [Dendrolimus kikuchii]|uniref:Uncharacterized protein n=1 Tax=Dendrolimus kikuchii TaxID=765133 RepID=A0ACC1DAA3_9NEOP|nr:hypothetical protein K1T71_004130 [Dendrolimus kikuchii]